MKNLLIIFFLFLSYNVVAQNNPSGVPTQFSTGWFRQGWHQSDSGEIIAPRIPNFTPRFPGTTILYQNNGVDTSIHYWTGGRWIKINAAGTDTTSLSNRINLKLNISDTTGKWLAQSTRLVDTMYRINDSTIGYTIKGSPYTFQILGGSSGGGGGSGTVTSVALSMPSAFSVSGSPITTSGTFNISGAGTTAQYIRGNGTLATTDTGMIPNYYLKVRGLLSGTSPITFNQITGAIGIPDANNTGTKGAATFNNSDFIDNGAGLISLRNPSGSAGVDTIYRTAGIDSIYYIINGNTYAIKDSIGGAGGVLNNTGVGFRWLATPSGDFKTVSNSPTIKWDSTSTANTLTAKADTSVLGTKYDLSLKQSFMFINVKDFGATGDGITDDAAAIQSAFDWVRDHPTTVYKIVFPAGNYLINSTIQLPQRINGTTESPRLGVEGYGAKIFTSNAIAIFERMPATQTIALDSLISNWICTIKGITFEGNNTSGQSGIRVGAIYSWGIEDCTFRTLDTALNFRFSLQGTIKNCRFQSCKSENIVLLFGEMWGGSDANSASNSNSIENCRVFGANGSYSHLRAEAANAVLVKNFISEGFNPRYNLILDSRGSTTVTFCNVEDIHLESDGGIYPVNTRFKIRAGGVFSIKNIYDQYPDTLFNSANTAGSATIIFDRIAYTGSLPAVPFNTETGSSVLGYNLLFQNMADGDFFKSKIANPASWANGVVPIEVGLYYQKGGGTGALTFWSNGSIALDKNTTLEGTLRWPTDDFYAFGGIPNINNSRPSAAYVGTTGLFVDNIARYNFGSATTAPDAYFERNGATIIQVGKSLKTIDSLIIGLTRVGANTDSILVVDAVSRAVKTIAQSSLASTTIYTGDGTLSGNRTVTGSNNSLTFNGMFNYRVNGNAFILDKTTPTAPYSMAVLGSSNQLFIGFTPVPTVYSKGSGIAIDTNNNVGIGTAPATTLPLYSTGLSTTVQGFQSTSSNYYLVENINGNVTANLQDYYFRIDATSGNITITLPAASTAFGNSIGIRYIFKRIDNSGNTVSVVRAGSDTIDGGTSISLTTQYEVKEIQCSSTSTWDVL